MYFVEVLPNLIVKKADDLSPFAYKIWSKIGSLSKKNYYTCIEFSSASLFLYIENYLLVSESSQKLIG